MGANDQSELGKLRALVVLADSEVSITPPNGYFEYPDGATEPDGTEPTVVRAGAGHTTITLPRALNTQEYQVWAQVQGGAGYVSQIALSGGSAPAFTTLDIHTVDVAGDATDLSYILNIEKVRTVGADG